MCVLRSSGITSPKGRITKATGHRKVKQKKASSPAPDEDSVDQADQEAANDEVEQVQPERPHRPRREHSHNAEVMAASLEESHLIQNAGKRGLHAADITGAMAVSDAMRIPHLQLNGTSPGAVSQGWACSALGAYCGSGAAVLCRMLQLYMG